MGISFVYFFIIFRTSLRDECDCAPAFVILSAAAADANFTAESMSSKSLKPASSEPVKQSPAPRCQSGGAGFTGTTLSLLPDL